MLQFDTINTNNILVLPIIDSTNNYAHQLINKNVAKHGLIVQALHQTNGKGQRGKDWESLPNQNLLMSIIIHHKNSLLESQFILNMAVSLAIKKSISGILNNADCTIKWSNDIYINNNKIAGILIENIIKGSTWSSSIIGIGVNVNENFNGSTLSNPTSIFNQTEKNIDINLFRNILIENINDYLNIAQKNENYICESYNEALYKKNTMQPFLFNSKTQNLKIIEVLKNGELLLENENKIKAYKYGDISQIIENL